MPTDNLQERYIGFITDYAFKRFFGTEANKELLIDFLNSLFEGKEVITDLRYKNTEFLPDKPFDRKAVFDVYCTNEKGEHFIVEMQNGKQIYYKARSVYYSTFPIQTQAKTNEWNFRLDKVYSINILNFNLDEKNPTRYRRDILLADLEVNEIFFEELHYVYIELPKFNLKLSELKTQLERWIYAIKYLSNFKRQPAELAGKVFTRLFQIAEIAKFSPKETIQYNASLKEVRDYFAQLDYKVTQGIEKGKKEGIKIGEKRGIEIGEKRGIEKGEKRGIEKEKINFAKKMLKDKLPIEMISKYTGLSIEEIKKLSNGQD